VGGFAQLATLVKRMKASRPGALLLDGGDTWQGSGTALWTNGQDMVDACKLLGVDVMTGHWEFTLGMERVKEIIEKDFKGKADFVPQHVKTNDFGDPVFKPYVIREINGVPCAIIDQAFPYTPIANPRCMVADWAFGIQDYNMQKMVDEARGKGAQVTDNLFNPDPYYQQCGDMVRVGGLRYSCNPLVWDVVETSLKARGGTVSARKLNAPKITGGLPNPGYAA
jgi:2',3'-cyclic-nucleotide 2'-phosphodiesterase (5'-nucleotidase family)